MFVFDINTHLSIMNLKAKELNQKLTYNWRLTMNTYEDLNDRPLQNVIRDGGIMNIYCY